MFQQKKTHLMCVLIKTNKSYACSHKKNTSYVCSHKKKSYVCTNAYRDFLGPYRFSGWWWRWGWVLCEVSYDLGWSQRACIRDITLAICSNQRWGPHCGDPPQSVEVPGKYLRNIMEGPRWGEIIHYVVREPLQVPKINLENKHTLLSFLAIRDGFPILLKSHSL